MSDIVWEDPPPKATHKRASKVAPFFDALREHPGKWALYKEASTSASVCTQIKSGRGYPVTPGEFDAATRKNEDGTYRIYVRFVGPEIGRAEP